VRPRALVAMSDDTYAQLFSGEQRRALSSLVELDGMAAWQRLDTPAAVRALSTVEVLVTGWGAPVVDATVLAHAPHLRAVVHTAGSVKAILTREVWDRGIAVTTCAAANAIPVAEFTLAAILLSGKRAFRRRTRDVAPWLGNYRRTVGIVGASRIGRRVLDLLRLHEFDLLLYDPYVSHGDAARYGARKLTLDQLLAASDIVSLHAPSTPETHHMLDARRLGLLKNGAVLINTSRGALVDTAALTEHLVRGRIDAVLDVTDPEPLPPDSVLHQLDNVFLTPHVAGSLGGELHRLAAMALSELARFAEGRPLEQSISLEQLDISA
jgi:phosphoglycerate dehydrogenase-like enzyme